MCDSVMPCRAFLRSLSEFRGQQHIYDVQAARVQLKTVVGYFVW